MPLSNEKAGLIGYANADKTVANRSAALDKSKFLKWLNLASFLVSVAVNGLGASGKISGYAVGNVSDTYATKFTPTGWAFSIWGIIYTGLAGFVIWQMLPRNTENVTLWVDFGYLFLAANVVNSLWIVVWVQNTDNCVIISCILLLLLLGIVMLMTTRAQTWARDRPGGAVEFAVVDVTFSIYSGWLTVASTVNVTAALVAAKWDGSPWTDEGWSVLMACVAAAIFLAYVWRRQDGAYGLVYTWAALAIASANKETSDAIYDSCTALAAVVGVASLSMLAYRVQKVHRASLSA